MGSVKWRKWYKWLLLTYLFFQISLCCQRKQEREYVLYGGPPPGQDGENNENGEVKEAEEDKEDEEEEEDDDEHLTSVSGTYINCVLLVKFWNFQEFLENSKLIEIWFLKLFDS